MPGFLLEVRSLTVSYEGHRRPVLNDVNFHMHEGEICGLMGDSGCGKSTLGWALLNLLPPRARILKGSVLHQSIDILQCSPRAARRMRGGQVAMVGQDPEQALNPVLRIGVQVEEAIRSHHEMPRAARRPRVREVLEAVGLGNDRMDVAFPHQLSGGQRQRVLLAQALAARPRLLVADEPTTALDGKTETAILDILKQASLREGLAILFITHDAALLRGFADRLLVMGGGAVAEERG